MRGKSKGHSGVPRAASEPIPRLARKGAHHTATAAPKPCRQRRLIQEAAVSPRVHPVEGALTATDRTCVPAADREAGMAVAS